MTRRLILHCRTTHLETQPHLISASLAENHEAMVPLRLAAWINTRLHIPRELPTIPVFASYWPWSMLQCMSKSLIEVLAATVPRAVRHHSASPSTSRPRPDGHAPYAYRIRSLTDIPAVRTAKPSHPGESLRATHSLQIFVMNYWTATRPAD